MHESVLAELQERLERLSTFAEKEKVKVDVKEAEKTKLQLSIKDKNTQSQVLLKVVELFKSLGGENERGLLNKLEAFVSYGLCAVFGEDYSFITELGSEGKDLRVDFFVQTGEIKGGVVNAKGGGIADVVSILLQLFFVVVLRGTLAPFLLLDTAMVNLSKCYHSNMSTLLKELCEQLDIQIVLLAHAGEYGDYADKLYRFSQEEGKTIVEEVK